MPTSPGPRTPHRVIVFYLPQFYPVPENNQWWEPGYTEWTAVARARPLFPGHRQPRYPAELGYYDLRVPETRSAQAQLAREHGIEGFCYWHYWLGSGKRMLSRPFDEVLQSGEPTFPFCLAWANHDWYDKSARGWKLLMRQEYPGQQDESAHFRAVEPAFHDHRYLRIDGKPIFFIFRPDLIPEPRLFADHWRDLAQRSGLPGLFLIGRSPRSELDAEKHGLDALQGGESLPLASRSQIEGEKYRPDFLLSGLNRWLCQRLHLVEIQSYKRWAPFMPHLTPGGYSFPVAYSNWDSTPRWGRRGSVMVGETPELFRQQLTHAFRLVADRAPDHRLVFVKSWNEWAEGNYLEPDLSNGRSLLTALHSAVEGSAQLEPSGAILPPHPLDERRGHL